MKFNSFVKVQDAVSAVENDGKYTATSDSLAALCGMCKGLDRFLEVFDVDGVNIGIRGQDMNVRVQIVTDMLTVDNGEALSAFSALISKSKSFWFSNEGVDTMEMNIILPCEWETK